MGTEDKAEEKTAHVKKCGSCGASMVFDPDSGMLVCPYCGAKSEVEDAGAQIREHDFQYGENAPADWGTETISVHCQNCGAEVTLSADESAEFCAFCGSSMVVKSEKNPGIVPEAVLPFKVTSDNAVSMFKLWIKSRFFSPGKLKTQGRLGRIKGVYIPHFTFDCKTFSSYTAEAGTYYYVTEPVWVEENGRQVQKTQQVRKVSWRPVSGTHSDSFDDVLVNASKNVDRKLIRLHFDLTLLKPYTPDYLYGFLAENYSISPDDCWMNARDTVDWRLNQSINGEIAADEVRNLQVATDYFDRKFKEILLPVWISAYTYKNRTYKFMVNGQSGDIKGQAPVSAPRVLLSVLVTLGLPALVYRFSPTASVFVFLAALITLLVLAFRKPRNKPSGSGLK